MKDRKALIALILTVLIWGSSFAAIKVVLDEITPLGLAFLRSAVATFALISLLRFNEGFTKLRKTLREKPLYFLLLGVVGVVLFNILQNLGIQYTSSGIASVLLATNPLFVLILGALFLRERLTGYKLVGIPLGFTGVAIVIFASKGIVGFFGSGSFAGNILVLCSALCWSTYVLMNKKVLGQYSPLLLTTSAFIFGSALLFVLFLYSQDLSTLSDLSISSWLLVVYLGFVSSAFAYFLWNYALRRMEASKASVFLFLIPVVAILLGKAFLAEEASLSIITGIALVLLGIYLTQA